MYARLLNSDNDIVLKDGHVARASTFREQAKQKIATVLHTFQGECFTDPETGVPWFGDILGNDMLAADAAREEIRDAIKSVAEVESCDDLELTLGNRNISVRYGVTLTDGTTLDGTVSEENP